MLVEKLPKLFQSSQLIVKLAELTQGRKILFSSLVYLNHGKTYIVKKTENTPYFQKDWQCYSFFRCYANTLITTAEKDLFKSYFACGDKNIEQMYGNFKQNDKKNVYVMTKSMTKPEIMPYFNSELYNVVQRDFVQEPKINEKSDDLAQILQGLIQTNLDPVLIECGPVVMKQHFESIRNGTCKNFIDGAYIAYFEGQLSPQSIGNPFEFEQNLFEEIWQSQKFNVEWKGQSIGTLLFKFYSAKQL